MLISHIPNIVIFTSFWVFFVILGNGRIGVQIPVNSTILCSYYVI